MSTQGPKLEKLAMASLLSVDPTVIALETANFNESKMQRIRASVVDTVKRN